MIVAGFSASALLAAASSLAFSCLAADAASRYVACDGGRNRTGKAIGKKAIARTITEDKCRYRTDG